MKEERSIGALIMALLTLGLLAAAYVGPWFEYDFSTGRHVAPDGPYPDDVDGVERDHLEMYATHWEGDVEPADEALATKWSTWTLYTLYGTAGALAIVFLGEIPFIARILVRPLGLVLLFGGMAAVATMAALSWLWLPETMAAYGVTEPYTARLEEPDGYTHSTLAWGYYALLLSWAGLFAAFLFKFQAGEADADILEEAVKARSSSS